MYTLYIILAPIAMNFVWETLTKLGGHLSKQKYRYEPRLVTVFLCLKGDAL